MMKSKKPYRLLNHGQSATELAIFGSILIFIIALIFRQGLSGGNFMNSQLKATRYAMSKSLESSAGLQTGRNAAAVLVIEDRLAGDFGAKLGSRDRTPVIASAGATFSSQMFQPVDNSDFGNEGALPHYDVWINGQRFSFTSAAFSTKSIPTSQGALSTCGQPHPTDSRCWDPDCLGGQGCVVLHKIVQNFPGSGFDPNPPAGAFDVNFDGTDPVAAAGVSKNPATNAMAFMWQWQKVLALDDLPTNEPIDVDGDFQEEQILAVAGKDGLGRITSVNVIDRQDGDLDFTIDSRRPNTQVGLLELSQMYSFTQSGTVYLIDEKKLVNPSTGQFVRNTNRNDHIDIVQRIFQLSNDTGRFCDGNNPQPKVDGRSNPVEACNNCFSQANVQYSCLDVPSLKLFARSRVVNQGGRSWFTRTETGP